ncbi:hypothetical protein [Paenibacillus gallinarum]|uniref:Uncharacterized protein n=1 Tax=Paenibacillus gallinarum TaxID=2762232 RepID=A0ABR8T3L1_9BACL|nr:hypothetical protein [Paenibacillus gallinarum]MBD7970341.1 hypothetical protein [Paenibacillus gallinarum]
MKNLTKVAKVLTTAALFTGLIAGSAYADSGSTKEVTNNSPLISVESLNNNSELKKIGKSFTLDEIPTIENVNIALTELNVSSENPYQKIDLGNGFYVEAGGGITTPTNSNETANSRTIQNKTASGYFSVNVAGVKLYDINVSASYTYDDSTTKIKTVQNPISASASGFFGWTGEITNKLAYKIDDTAYDLVADAKYKYIKLIGDVSGHIEVRFTATGNWYMHDTYIGDVDA